MTTPQFETATRILFPNAKRDKKDGALFRTGTSSIPAGATPPEAVGRAGLTTTDRYSSAWPDVGSTAYLTL